MSKIFSLDSSDYIGLMASWISFAGKHKKCFDILKSVGVV